MRVLIKSFSTHDVSQEHGDSHILVGRDCREIVEAMRAMAPFAGCPDCESYMRWTLHQLNGEGEGERSDLLEGDTPQARAEFFLALLGEMGRVEFLCDSSKAFELPAKDKTVATNLESGSVLAPRAVLDGIEAVRQSGQVNMFDVPAVICLACELGHHTAADWIATNMGFYSAGIFRGFVANCEGK